MKNRKLILVLFMFLVAGCLSAPLYAVTLMLPERQGPPGSILKVPVYIENADSTVAGLDFVVEFDRALLEPIDITKSSLTMNFEISFRVEGSRVAASMASATGINRQNGALAYLVFRIRQSAQTGTSTELTWRKNNLYSTNALEISCETKHGVIKVLENVVFPNPFTPNQDGYNDAANFVIPDSLANNVMVKIFGVSGNSVAKLTTTGGSELSWDGTNSDGNPASPGVYLYVILANGEAYSKGTITLMR